MARIARARGYAQARIFDIGAPVPGTIGPASWIKEDETASDVLEKGELDNLATRTAKALRETAKAEKVTGIETDDNKADLIRKIRAHRAAKAEKAGEEK